MVRKVSIIIITYNALEDVKECLLSLEKQDYSDIEVVVVNDASTDLTADFLHQYQADTSLSLTVVANSSNLGVAGARNAGIPHATGEIIAFTDSDCVADRSWISELVRIYEHKDVAAVGGGIADARITNIWELSEKGHDFVANQEGYVNYIQGCNMSFNTTVLKNYMFNDEIKYGYEEALLCDYLIRDGYRIYYVPQALVHHKHRNNFRSLMRRKYLLGVSSIWYRKKQKKLIMFKRHIIFLFALLLIPFSLISNLFLYLAILLFLIFTLSLLRDEFLFESKTIREMIMTLPFLVLIEFSHFWGSCVGVIRFRLLKAASRYSYP